MSDARYLPVAEHLPLNSTKPEESDANTSPTGVSAGSLLRQAREAAGMHIATLAVLLKVPVKKLEALEADRFDLLPDAVFVRALASSVCRNLKIDTAPILQRLPQTVNSSPSQQNRGINTPFFGSGDQVGLSVWAQVSRPAVLAGLALLLAALVLVLLPTLKTDTDANSRDVTPKAIDTQTSMSEATGVSTETLPAAASAPLASVSPGSLPSSAASASVPVSGSQAVAAPARLLPAPVALQAPVLPASAASATTSVAATGIVVFTAKGASWVQVTDSKGVVVLRRILVPGEVVGASGVLPLSAIVGKADATQVQVRGNAFDLAAVTKDNVAKFEVK